MKMKRGRYVVFPAPPPAFRIFSFRCRNIRLKLTGIPKLDRNLTAVISSKRLS